MSNIVLDMPKGAILLFHGLLYTNLSILEIFRLFSGLQIRNHSPEGQRSGGLKVVAQMQPTIFLLWEG